MSRIDWSKPVPNWLGLAGSFVAMLLGVLLGFLLSNGLAWVMVKILMWGAR